MVSDYFLSLQGVRLVSSWDGRTLVYPALSLKGIIQGEENQKIKGI